MRFLVIFSRARRIPERELQGLATRVSEFSCLAEERSSELSRAMCKWLAAVGATHWLRQSDARAGRGMDITKVIDEEGDGDERR
jgi:hypothetical protein